MKLLCWKEGEQWLVACRYFDVVAQGRDQSEAFHRFCQTFTMTVLDRTTNGVIGPLPVPPPEVVKEWERKAGLSAQLDLDRLKRMN